MINKIFLGKAEKLLPRRSAPSSTSPMRPVPALDSSSNRESVFRLNALFSIPLVGVLEHITKCYPLIMRRILPEHVL